MKRILCLCMVFILLAVDVSPAFATSSETGSSDVGYVGDMPLYTASGGVDGHIALTAFLGASGIYLKVTADASTWEDVCISLDSLWAEFRAVQDNVQDIAESLYDTGASIVRGGLALAKRSWNGYCKFGAWLKEKLGFGDNEDDIPVTGGGSVSLDNRLYYMEKVFFGKGQYASFVGDGYVQLRSNTDNIYFAYKYMDVNRDKVYVVLYNAGTETTNISYYIYVSDISVNDSVSIGSGSFKVMRDNVYVTECIPGIPIYDYNVTVPETPPIIGGGGSDDDDVITIDTGTVDIPEEIPEDATGKNSVRGLKMPGLGTLVGAGLAGAAGGAGAGAADIGGGVVGAIIEGVLEGVMSNIDITPGGLDVAPDIEIAPDGTIEQSTLTVNASDIYLDTGTYLVNIFDYFPFSIPKDIVTILAVLNAPAEIPVFDVPFDLPDELGDTTYTVDLSDFDGVARLCRSGELLAFVVLVVWKIWQVLGR